MSNKDGAWSQVVAFLGMELFGDDAYHHALEHIPELDPPSNGESPLDVRLAGWEWALFRLVRGIKNYLKEKEPFLPGQLAKEYFRAACGLADLF